MLCSTKWSGWQTVSLRYIPSTDITEEPLIAGQFLVYSGPTVLLLMDGKEVYRASQFIDLEKLKYNINRYIELLAQ